MATLKRAAELYINSCDTCHESLEGGNCAHYTSNALAKAGFNICAPHDTINARCNAPKGSRRIIRAHELRDWIRANTSYTCHATKPPVGTAAFFHCLRNRDGMGHVGLIDVHGLDRDTGTGSHFGDVHTFYY